MYPQMKHPHLLASTSKSSTTNFAILAAVSLLFSWRSLGETFALALTDEAYTHLLLIIPLSATLAYTAAKELSLFSQFNVSPANVPSKPTPLSFSQSSRCLGVALLVLATLIASYARWTVSAVPGDIALSLAIFALVIWWIASVMLCFGWPALRSFLFPLCLLFLLVPMPAVVLSVVVGWLQHGSAWMAGLLFHAVGEPVHRDGIFLHLTGLDLEVAAECSSIRSSCLLVITTIVLAHLFLRSWRRNLLLVLIAIPLSIAKNALRIFVIAEVGMHIDRGFLDGKFHHHGGIVFLILALCAIIGLVRFLHRGERQAQIGSACAGPILPMIAQRLSQ